MPDTTEIALRIFCAMMTRPDAKVSTGDRLGEQQIATCFTLAETFEAVAQERRDKNPPLPPSHYSRGAAGG
jgi:hypothetical protein